MDQDLSQSIPANTILYRCACGRQLMLDSSKGGDCDTCGRGVTPKMLDHDLAMTVTLEDEHFELDQTLPGIVSSDDDEIVVQQDEESNAADPDVLVGKMFGHFKLIAPIGRGGMGQVYCALDTSLQRYAAVKVLKSGIGSSQSRSSDTEVDKLLQEAVSQARVAHPNVVTIYYVGKHHGAPFLAMELVNGEPLSKRIAADNISFDQIGPIAIDIANALKISYEIGIIHGDIKPSNVLIARNGTAKLSDFGMARDISDESAAIGGTPNYIAPEVLMGKKPTVQSDIYSLGVTFFEMTFDTLPVTLSGYEIEGWLKKHEENELEFPAQWPAHLPELWKTILRTMLAQDPADRYQTYEALLSDLENIQPESKVDARIFPRVVAAGLDWITVLFLAGLVQFMTRNGFLENFIANYPSTMTLFKIAEFLPLVAYIALIYWWRQSLGRNLMHLRVINQYGLKPSSTQILIRSALRMQFPFMAIFLQFFRAFQASSVQNSLTFLFMASLGILLIDAACLLIFRRRTLHDLVTKTSVVLDTGKVAN